jgi:DNA-binding transcriptional LysR family regulator
MDIFRAMDLFVRIVDKGSLTAAAADCDLSPTMVGNHLHALENRLGARLLNRTTRRQSLTDFGKTYYQRCVEVLELVRGTEALALEAQSVPKGLLRITAPVTFGTERLMPAIADYAASYPKIELDIVITDTVVDLAADGFEAAIRIGNVRDADLVARPLAPYQLILCAAPQYLAERGRPQRPEDFSRHDCLAYNFSSRSEWRSAEAVWRIAGPSGRITIPFAPRLRIDSAEGLRRAALAGMGIVMLPEIMLSNDLQAGRLVRLLPDYDHPIRPLNLVYLGDRRMLPKLRSFVDFVVERFGVARRSVDHSSPV